MRNPIHHLHIRKRKQSKKDPYPHPHPWVNLLDRVVLFGGVLGPLMTLPQIHKIFALQTAAGVSLVTWLIHAIFDVPWIIYGVVHDSKPIMVAYLLWFVTNMAVVIGVLMYP